MSKIVPIRLNASEQDMLACLVNRDNCEASNAGELFRLLLHREFRRCKGLTKPSFAEIASDMRVGRPVALTGVAK